MHPFFKVMSVLGFASSLVLVPVSGQTHPHVFAEVSLDIVRNEKGAFSELRQVWRFDELFTTGLKVDFDTDGDLELGAEEMATIIKTIKESIAEYDFYTAMRAGEDILPFNAPHEFTAYLEEGQLIMLVALKPDEPYEFDKGALRISTSDETFYVSFEFLENNVKVSGGSSDCTTNVTVPDFDELYANNSQTLSESFFNDNQDANLGDEFYSWAEVKC